MRKAPTMKYDNSLNYEHLRAEEKEIKRSFPSLELTIV